MAHLGSMGWQTSMPSFQLSQNGQPVPPLASETLLGRVPPGYFDVGYMEESVPLDADVYVFQHATHQWMLEWAARLRKKNPRAKILLDIDDDFHRVPTYNPAKLDPGNSPLTNRRNVIKFLEMCDGATFATAALQDFYSRWQPNSRVIGNYLHWNMWAQLPPVFLRREWARPRIGYMGRVDYHSEDIKLIAKPLRKWLLRNPEVEFVAAGDPRIHDLVGTPESQQVSTSLVFYRGLDLPYITSCFDVGLIPLVRNDFNQGKSYLKGLEYAACGIPSIASPTEPYRSFIDEGVTGRLADKPGDFIAALDDSLDNVDAWGQMGRNAFDKARDYSLDRRINEWAEWFTHCCGDNSHSEGPGILAGAVS